MAAHHGPERLYYCVWREAMTKDQFNYAERRVTDQAAEGYHSQAIVEAILLLARVIQEKEGGKP
jgi:hypothetical protein